MKYHKQEVEEYDRFWWQFLTQFYVYKKYTFIITKNIYMYLPVMCFISRVHN